MSPPLVALIALVASSLVATTMAFIVPTGTSLGSVSGAEQQGQKGPILRRLGMVVDDNMNTAAAAGGGESSSSRVGFLREQGALGVAALGTLGLSSPVVAAGLFDIGQNDKIDLEKVPPRFIIGKTQFIMWSTIAPSIAAMRTEARERFAATKAKGGREISSYSNPTPDGSNVTVGLEVTDPKDSPALGGGFTATMIAPPGDYLRDNHSTSASMATWVTFVTRIPKQGYELIEPLSIFEVYTGTGGRDEGVAMYAAVKTGSE